MASAILCRDSPSRPPGVWKTVKVPLKELIEVASPAGRYCNGTDLYHAVGAFPPSRQERENEACRRMSSSRAIDRRSENHCFLVLSKATAEESSPKLHRSIRRTRGGAIRKPASCSFVPVDRITCFQHVVFRTPHGRHAHQHRLFNLSNFARNANRHAPRLSHGRWLYCLPAETMQHMQVISVRRVGISCACVEGQLACSAMVGDYCCKRGDGLETLFGERVPRRQLMCASGARRAPHNCWEGLLQ